MAPLLLEAFHIQVGDIFDKNSLGFRSSDGFCLRARGGSDDLSRSFPVLFCMIMFKMQLAQARL